MVNGTMKLQQKYHSTKPTKGDALCLQCKAVGKDLQDPKRYVHEIDLEECEMECFHSYEVKILGEADATYRAISLFEQTLIDECDVEILENGNALISADYDGSCDVEELVEDGFLNWANQLAKEKVSVEFFVIGSVEWGELFRFFARYQNGQFSVDYDEDIDEDEFEAIDCYDGLWEDEEDEE